MDLLNKILKDIKVECLDEFDKNFERKAFFNQKWPERRYKGKGSLMLVTGQLRRSIRGTVGSNYVEFSSNLPYAQIHNYGGRIIVTANMKKYFWARYMESKSDYWKAMALKKVGSAINMPRRQFLGPHPTIIKACQTIAEQDIKEYLEKQLKIK